MKSILFILPVATQPRFSKRIDPFLLNDYKVTVATYERDYFILNTLPENIELINLGKVQHGNYLKRIPVLLRSLRTLILLSKVNDIVYIFSSDILLFFFLFIPKWKLIYEIGDIRVNDWNKIVSLIFSRLYRKALLKCSRINVTSQGFKNYLIKEYYINNEDKICLLENKLSTKNFSAYQESFKKLILEKNKLFTIGIIGLLRYRNIIDFLQEYSKQCNHFVVKIYGDGPLLKEIQPFIDEHTVQYFGQFKYPDDIKKIYDNIDISFVMYDSDDLNVQLALPNKLYESFCFKKPLIVSSNTYLAQKVRFHNIGFVWDQKNIADLITFLNSEKFVDEYNDLEKSFSFVVQKDYLESSYDKD